MRTLIIDYGMGNLGSVNRALEECDANPFISDDPRALHDADHIVMPGVGSFSDGMKHLAERGWTVPLRKVVLEDGIPFLGICLGMQLLAALGHEGGSREGLGFIPGEVKRLVPDSPSTRVPHVGWNEVRQARPSPLLHDIPDRADFYFVHSYYFAVAEETSVITTTPYCGSFISAVGQRNVYGVQFHPEKSSRPGFQLIRNFLSL